MAKKIEINWNKIEGNMNVYTNRLESKNGKPWYKSSVSIASTDKEGNWHNFYIDLKFVGKKAEEPKEEGKHIIEISNAFLSTDYWYDKKEKEERVKPVIVVLESEVIE